MPPLPFVVFELAIYAIAAYTFYRVGRRDRYALALLLVGLGFTLLLERAAIRSSLAYYYNPFLVMVGERPAAYPLCIGMLWTLLLHSVMRATRGLLLPWWWLPVIDALLAVSLALVLDPVLSANRVVSHFGEWCALRGYPLGAAPGLGLWIWCVPQQGVETLYGIPLDNFVAWFLVVFVFSMLVRVAERWLAPRARPPWAQLATSVGVGALSYYVTLYAVKGYGELVATGLSQTLVLCGVLVVPCAMLAVAGGTRSRYGYDWLALPLPLGLLGLCWMGYFATGVYRREGVGFFLFILGVSVLVLLVHAWLMRGRRPGFSIDAVLRRAPVSRPPATQPVTLARIEAIDALDDAALRNLWITQTYHDLSVELSRLTRPRNVNWASFATWASGAASESIRNEELPPELLDALQLEGAPEDDWRSLCGALRELHSDAAPDDIVDVVREAVATVSAQVAEGNRKVFAELAPCFVAFMASFRDATHYDPARYEAFAVRFKPGAVDSGGQGPLRSAYGAYYRAMFEPDRTRKAQWMLLGNVQIGLHEQSRLQPSIQAATDTALSVRVRERLAARACALVPAARHEQVATALAKTTAFDRWLDAIWARFATLTMMHVSLPGGVSIGLDEEPRGSQRRGHPRALHGLTEPEVATVVGRYCTTGSLSVAPSDWADLNQRMAAIVELFRATQQHASLLAQPFTRRQRVRLFASLAREAAADRPH